MSCSLGSVQESKKCRICWADVRVCAWGCCHTKRAVQASVLAHSCWLGGVCLGSPASPWAFEGSCWKDGVVGFSPVIPIKAEDAGVGIWCCRFWFVKRGKGVR